MKLVLLCLLLVGCCDVDSLVYTENNSRVLTYTCSIYYRSFFKVTTTTRTFLTLKEANDFCNSSENKK